MVAESITATCHLAYDPTTMVEPEVCAVMVEPEGSAVVCSVGKGGVEGDGRDCSIDGYVGANPWRKVVPTLAEKRAFSATSKVSRLSDKAHIRRHNIWRLTHYLSEEARLSL